MKVIIADITLPVQVIPVLLTLAAGWAVYITRALINIKSDLLCLKNSLGIKEKAEPIV